MNFIYLALLLIIHLHLLQANNISNFLAIQSATYLLQSLNLKVIPVLHLYGSPVPSSELGKRTLSKHLPEAVSIPLPHTPSLTPQLFLEHQILHMEFNDTEVTSSIFR